MSTRQAETYAIINITDLPLIDFSQIGETGENTIRKSLDELQFLIKWNTEPTFIADGTVVPVQIMSHRESLVVMNNSEWQQPMPVD
tara:strand:+ start:3511 stop:3768 length:258 start_codon:yes stop_codon:yes gene_type:complete